MGEFVIRLRVDPALCAGLAPARGPGAPASRVRRVQAHGAEVRCTLEEGAPADAARATPACTVELAFERGDPAGLYRLAADWIAAYGLWIDPLPAPERAALPVARRGFLRACKATPPTWGRQAAVALGGTALLRRMVGDCLAQVVANAGEIAAGSNAAEHVHQLRVGLRRLRSAARGMKRFAGGLPPDWEAATAPVFAALGRSRDAQVQARAIAPALRHVGAPAWDAHGRALAGALAQAVRDADFQRALVGLLAFATAADDAGAADGSGLATLARALRRLGRQVARDAPHVEDLSFAHLHGLRKRLKRLRYLAEFAAPAFDPAAVRTWLAVAAPAQDDLGQVIDLVQAGARFAAMTPDPPDARFARRWLRERERRALRAAAKSLARLRRTPGFWAD